MNGFIKNFAALLFGLFICVMLIAITEVVLRYVNYPSGPVLSFSPDVEYKNKDQFGILKANPGYYNFRKESGGGMIYDVNYTINKYGHRSTLSEGQKSKHAIFFGDSYTFGEGVNDDETIPALFSMGTEYAPYNFGFSGDGPFDILAKVESYDLSKGQKYQEGVIFYVFNDAQIYRVKGDLHEISWQWERPYYTKQNSRLARAGSFLTGRKLITKALLFLRESEILRVLNIGRIKKVSDDDLFLTKKAVLQVWEKLDEQLPVFKKYLVIYPGSGDNVQKFKHMIEDDINVIDLSALFPLSGKYQIEGDGHPNKLANQSFVDEIKTFLKQEMIL